MTAARGRAPAGERLATLEERSDAIGSDLAEVKQQLREIAEGVKAIDIALAQHRGGQRAARVVFGLVQTLGGGAVGAVLARLLH